MGRYGSDILPLYKVCPLYEYFSSLHVEMIEYRQLWVSQMLKVKLWAYSKKKKG